MVIIACKEEWGYRYWLWIYPKSFDEILDDWNAGIRPGGHSITGKPNCPGLLQQIDYNMYRSIIDNGLSDGECYFCEEDTTRLIIGDETYYDPEEVAQKKACEKCTSLACKNGRCDVEREYIKQDH